MILLSISDAAFGRFAAFGVMLVSMGMMRSVPKTSLHWRIADFDHGSRLRGAGAVAGEARSFASAVSRRDGHEEWRRERRHEAARGAGPDVYRSSD
jgi:hypothetical protein